MSRTPRSVHESPQINGCVEPQEIVCLIGHSAHKTVGASLSYGLPGGDLVAVEAERDAGQPVTFLSEMDPLEFA
jgi:hypothetical protein